MSQSNNVNEIIMPDFKIEESKIPNLKIKSLRLQGYKAFEDYTLDFTNKDGSVKNFCCFFGPNGCGKTTILNAVQLVFSRFEGMAGKRLRTLLGKSVRHDNSGAVNGIYGESDFLVTAIINDPNGDYEVRINKDGFIEGYDHSQDTKNVLKRILYYTRFDMELDKFQLARSKWEVFKELFEAVTGFKIKEEIGLFDESEDPLQAEMLSRYVLGFTVHKPNEIIAHRECSAGERKIIKSFSTLLNQEYIPRVILVDNIAMHVESGRHLELIKSMKKCFPESQIFATTHSYHISKNFGNRNQLYDLRLVNASCIIKDQPWRLYFADELTDSIPKLKSMSTVDSEKVNDMISIGYDLVNECLTKEKLYDISNRVKLFLSDVVDLYTSDILRYYERRKENR